MRFNRGIGFMLIAGLFLGVAVYRATRADGGGVVWIALGAAFIALVAASKKGKGGDDAPR